MKPETAGGRCGLGRIGAKQEKIKNFAASPKRDKENLFLPLLLQPTLLLPGESIFNILLSQLYHHYFTSS
jgi:hypothetical protein